MGGDVADELCLQRVVVLLQIDNLLLLAGLQDKAEQDDSADYQGGGKGTGKNQKTDDDDPAGGQRTVLVGNGCLVVGNLFLQSRNLVGMLEGIGGVFPCEIVAVRLCHHTGVIALSAIGYQLLVDLIHLVILLGGCQLVCHLLEDGVALCVQPEGIVIDSLAVEQVVPHLLVVGGISLCLHHLQLLLGTVGLPELHVHLQALFGDQVVQSGAVVPAFVVDGLVDIAEQLKSLLVKSVLGIEGCGFRSALNTLLHLSFAHIVLVGTDVVVTGCGNGLGGFRVLLQLTLLRLLRTDCYTAKSHAQQYGRYFLIHKFVNVYFKSKCKSMNFFLSIQINERLICRFFLKRLSG